MLVVYRAYRSEVRASDQLHEIGFELKRKTVDGVVYDCPMYLVRAGSGWQVRMPGQKTCYFSDSVYGGVAGAYLAALKHRHALAPITAQSRPLAETETQQKLRPTGVPGIFLVETIKRGRTRPQFSLQVRMGEFPIRTFYVSSGVLDTTRLDSKMNLARVVRSTYESIASKPVMVRLACEGAGAAKSQ